MAKNGGKLRIALSGDGEEDFASFPDVIETIQKVLLQIIRSHPGSTYLIGCRPGAEFIIARTLHQHRQKYHLYLPCLNYLEILKSQNQHWAKSLEPIFKKALAFFSPHFRLDNSSWENRDRKMVEDANCLVLFSFQPDQGKCADFLKMGRRRGIKTYRALPGWEEF